MKRNVTVRPDINLGFVAVLNDDASKWAAAPTNESAKYKFTFCFDQVMQLENDLDQPVEFDFVEVKS